MNDSRLVEVYAARNGIEAHFLRGLLEEEGIAVRVVGEGLTFAMGDLPLGLPTAPRLWVLEDNSARARELILEWEQSRAASADEPDDPDEAAE
jgi:hypothetical protein